MFTNSDARSNSLLTMLHACLQIFMKMYSLSKTPTNLYSKSIYSLQKRYCYNGFKKMLYATWCLIIHNKREYVNVMN